MGPDKAAVFLQLAAQLVHAADALQHPAAAQVYKQGPVYYLAVFYMPQVYAGDAALAAQYDTIAMLLFAGGYDGIHQGENRLFAYGLQLIEKRLHRIGVHSVLRGGGKEYYLNVFVDFSYFRRGVYAGFPGHQHIQKQHVKPCALFYFRYQVQGAVECDMADIIIALFPVFV